jgi:hypothetical protein
VSEFVKLVECSVCYGASGEKDRSLYLVVFSSLWKTVMESRYTAVEYCLGVQNSP